jgi:hypothetical protein
MDLIVKVVEIKRECPVYKVGDSFKLEDGCRLISEIPLCTHFLADPFLTAGPSASQPFIPRRAFGIAAPEPA